MKLEVAYAQRPASGETVCGDAQLVLPLGDRVLLAVADGLGHGKDAALAGSRAVEVTREHHSLPLDDILRRVHLALRGTRGCQMSLLRLESAPPAGEGASAAGRLVFAGIGNVSLEAVSARPIRPITHPGVLGYQVSRFMVSQHEVHAGDLLALFSDGLRRPLGLDELCPLPAQTIADRLLQERSVAADDATVIVVRA